MDDAPPTRGRAGRGALRYRFSGSLRGMRIVGAVRKEMQGLQPRAWSEILHARTPAISSHWLEKRASHRGVRKTLTWRCRRHRGIPTSQTRGVTLVSQTRTQARPKRRAQRRIISHQKKSPDFEKRIMAQRESPTTHFRFLANLKKCLGVST